MVALGASRTDPGSRVNRVVAKNPAATTKERRHKEGVKAKQEDGETTDIPTTKSIDDKRPDIAHTPRPNSYKR